MTSGDRPEADAAEILSLRRELERRGAILLVYEQEIDDLTRAVAELSRLQENLRKDLQGLEMAMKEQKARDDAALARTTAELQRLRQSRSVRLTAPIRRLASLLRGR